jgi:hypothetical protein
MLILALPIQNCDIALESLLARRAVTPNVGHSLGVCDQRMVGLMPDGIDDILHFRITKTDRSTFRAYPGPASVRHLLAILQPRLPRSSFG